MPEQLSASVVIACYTEDRWMQLCDSINSASSQTLKPERVVVVVDHNPALQQRVKDRWPSVHVVANQYGQGASGARNTGAFLVDSAVVAFLDDDAVADPEWLSRLLGHFDDPSVVGVGGGVVAAWQGKRPKWFPDEFGWVIGVSYPGLPESISEVRNVWAENMAVRLSRFLEVDGFRLNFGKVGSHSSPEDTDLCIRMAQSGGRWLYIPSAQVAHHVPVSRTTLRFFMRRCYQEGSGKAALARISSGRALESERAYARQILPHAVGRNLLTAVQQRQFTPAAQAGLILVGLMATGLGYMRESLIRTGKSDFNSSAPPTR